MEVFWRNGYFEAPILNLINAMNINKSSRTLSSIETPSSAMEPGSGISTAANAGIVNKNVVAINNILSI
jgi:hypothetical protein